MFSEIKEGDIVMLRLPVGPLYGARRHFWVPKKVSSTTKARFRVGDIVFAETTGLDKKQLLGIANILINHTSLREVKIVMTRPMDNDIQNLLKEISDMGLRLYITECGQKTSWRLNE